MLPRRKKVLCKYSLGIYLIKKGVISMDDKNILLGAEAEEELSNGKGNDEEEV